MFRRLLGAKARIPYVSTVARRLAPVLLIAWATPSHAFFASLAASPNPNGGSFTVTWSNPSSLTYTLQQLPPSGSWGSVTTTTSTSYAFSGKSTGTWSYRLKYTKVQCSGFPEPTCGPVTTYSETIQVTVHVAPPVPTGLTGPATDYNGAYTISWNASSGASSYRLQEKVGSGSWTQIYSGSSISRAISGKSAGSYSYRVRACNSSSICSNWSTTHTTTVAAAPSTPTGLTAPTQDTDGSYTVSWNTATGASSYRLDEKVGSGSWAQIYSGAGTSRAISGKSPATYSYRVKGCNVESVCSNWSSSISVEVVPPNTAPTADAGPNLAITLPANANLIGSVLDDGLPNPPAAVTAAWSVDSGPGTVTFANASSASTSATFSTDGTYVLRLTADDSSLQASDTVTITVSPPAGCTGP